VYFFGQGKAAEVGDAHCWEAKGPIWPRDETSDCRFLGVHDHDRRCNYTMPTNPPVSARVEGHAQSLSRVRGAWGQVRLDDHPMLVSCARAPAIRCRNDGHGSEHCLNDQPAGLTKQTGERAPTLLGQLSPVCAAVRRRRARPEDKDKKDKDPFESCGNKRERRLKVDSELNASSSKNWWPSCKKAIKTGRTRLSRRSSGNRSGGRSAPCFEDWRKRPGPGYRRTYGIHHEWRTRQRAGHGVRQPGRRLRRLASA